MTGRPCAPSLLDRPATTPAQVITDLHETRVQNEPAAALLGRAPEPRGPATGFAYRWFTDRSSRATYPPEDHPHHSRVFVADLHAVAARRSHDTEVGIHTG